MAGKPTSARTCLHFERLEERIAPTAGARAGLLPAIAEVRSGRMHGNKGLVYTATLGLTDQAKALSRDDCAGGAVTLRFNGDGKQATISGSRSNISNVSAIVLLPTPSAARPGSTAGQTVAILLKPGSGSAVHHRSFSVSLSRFDLIGPLVGGPLTQLRSASDQHHLIIVVQTTNGVDSTSASTAGALQPGNFVAGELSGVFGSVSTR